jgi:hypothetical protein
MVRAAALSVGCQIRIKFDASSYFEQAIDREIIDLACGGWHSEKALRVAEFCAASGEFPLLSDALENVRSSGCDDLLIELHGPDALRWIREHRIDVVACIESVFGRGSCDPEGLDCGPYWDDDAAWDCAYEHRQDGVGHSRPA